ncbi:MAG TPA: ATP-binding cassette domain-containing protein [Acidimicrobiales bacterium]|nr:ATP-binding cassette domain-containing protein [Acidimicrobiales bacterium]
MKPRLTVWGAAGAHLLGGQHGHHGLRILVLVIVVAVVVVVAVLLVRRGRERRRYDERNAAGLRAVETKEPAAGFGEPVSPRSVRPTQGRGAAPAGIVAKGLTKRFGDKVAVDALSFEVTPGRVTGFLGPNGAGKSTTMRLVMGLDRPDGGSVLVNGRRYHDLAWPLREVGALLEAKTTHPGRTAYSHLWMLAKTNRLPRRRVDEVLDLVGLTSVARQQTGGFSLGMSQRLGIAAALLGDPGVLMFDEPVNGLDTDGIRWVRRLLRQLASEGRSVFVSSHLMSEMAKTADQLVVIGTGRLIAQMPVSEFTSRYAKGYVRVRSPQLDLLRPVLVDGGATVEDEEDRSISVRGMSQDAIGELAWRHSIMLHELAPQSASLEEAFVESTEPHLEFGGSHPPGTGSDAMGTGAPGTANAEQGAPEPDGEGRGDRT